MYPTSIRRRRALATPKPQPPVISNDTPNSSLTNSDVTVVGKNFGRFKGPGDIYLGLNSTYSACGSLTAKAAFNWSDTSATFHHGASAGLRYIYVVTKDGRYNEQGYAITFIAG